MSEDIKIKHGSLQELKNVSNNDGVIYFAKDDNFLNGKIYYDDPSGEGRINVSGVGYDISGQNGAGVGAEIFNDYEVRAIEADGSFKGNVATGIYSHAEGFGTTVSSNYSHAEGFNTAVSGEAGHAEGFGTSAKGDYSHAEGQSSSKVDDIITINSNTTDEDIIFKWYTNKFSLAKGTASHTEGQDNLALGAHSHTEGYQNFANGNNGSHAEGYYTSARGVASHSEGAFTIANNDYSHAEGYDTIVHGKAGHVEGWDSDASGDYSHAEGDRTTAYGKASHSEGVSTNSASYNIFDDDNNLKNNDAIEISWNSGKFSLAKGEASHVEGQDNLALGNYSHAEGFQTKAIGNSSHTNGQGTVAFGEAQTAIGKYNKKDSSNEYAFIVGNGTSDTSRSNAFAIGWDGNIYIKQTSLIDLIYPVGSIYMSVNNINPSTWLGGTWSVWGSGKVPIGVSLGDSDFGTVEQEGGNKDHTLTTAQIPSHTHSLNSHTHSLNSHTHSLNNHTHSIPSLTGTAASNGAHTHYNRMYQGGSSGSARWVNSSEENNTATWTSIPSAGAHTHSVSTNASTTGKSSGNTGASSGNTGASSGNTGATGSGSSFSLLQPYITCYMWKRTA